MESVQLRVTSLSATFSALLSCKECLADVADVTQLPSITSRLHVTFIATCTTSYIPWQLHITFCTWHELYNFIKYCPATTRDLLSCEALRYRKSLNKIILLLLLLLLLLVIAFMQGS